MIEIFCDGGSRGNPGHAAFGFVVYSDKAVVKKGSGYIGIATNNFAEYTAIVKALEWLSQNHKGEELKFYLDSQLAASQLSGLYKIKDAKIRDFVFQIRTLEPEFKSVSYTHIPRAQNKFADQLVNLALDSRYGTE
ncbi:ribonuclease HI family protein [Candidatus Curtissbacteria bacterium]|nr:ribonuclease HI family protein [Candidatus Curtissbacteria bacterium]